MKSISAEETQFISKLVFDVSGLHLDKDKGYLLETRLSPLLSLHGYPSFMQLYAQAKADKSGKLVHEIVEAMTTNETFFFRDTTPFDLMRNKIIPDLIDRRKKVFQSGKIPIRVWSAACSTGQEVYSIAMTLIEMFGDLSRYDIYILGTDIANKVIAQASYGKYNQFEMDRGLPLHYRKRFFSQVGTDWRIRDEVRSLAQFKLMNLMKPFADLGGKFDLIFCRNVAIYFNQSDKVRLFQKIARVLQPDGALVIGGSETLTGIAPDFESRSYLKGIFHQLRGQTAATPLHVMPSLPTRPTAPPVKVNPAKPHVPASYPVSPKAPESRPVGLSEPRDYAPLAKTETTITSHSAGAELEPAARKETTPPIPHPAQLVPSKTKTSLLAALSSAGKRPSSSLRPVSQGSTKTSLLEQLKRKNKKSNE
ncbi:MAG: methyltransferase domain-containing protein [Proteobacteria bacterium]|nr:methyltransferase domain-containing protein [Desulfobulbaceae bacterium]MBU4154316.1 methyltransferase domain-containing protein [Pseudomonadota bacterium]